MSAGRSLLLRATALLCLAPALVAARPIAATFSTEHVDAELIAHSSEPIAPGTPFDLGLVIRHAPHWHTYWLNPGDSGLATSLSWTLPAGAKVSDIRWPTPKALPFGPLTNYGYDGEVLLPVSVTLPADFQAETVDIALRADWLVCYEICIPETGEFSLQLPLGERQRAHAADFAQAQARAPKPLQGTHGTARIKGGVLEVALAGLPTSLRGQRLSVFPELGGVTEPSGRIEQRWDDGRWIATLPLSSQRSESPDAMEIVLAADNAATGYSVRLDDVGPWPGQATAAAAASASNVEPRTELPRSLPWVLLLALAGGVLLNLMPCVFPILSLKVFGFAQAGQNRSVRVAGGLAYTAGVILSFLALAGLLLALRAGGEQLGWGFQLQSPGFVAVLAGVFTLIGLNLAGVFELSHVLPSRIAGLRLRHPLADHALTGVLAVAVASPCTGPFMGAALGAALTLPALQALLVFTALGVGMALPYLVATVVPGVARRLPRPGAWMEQFKVLMAFPMFATVIWLLWVLGQQIGIDGMIGVLSVLLSLGFVSWAWGTRGIGRKGRWILVSTSILLLTATLGWAWPGIRQPTVGGPPVTVQAGGWDTWSPEAVSEARTAGRAVFVDFTAAWCVTCQWNKRATLSDPMVLEAFERRKVQRLRADWTHRDPAITRELATLGRSGVPVYALYAPDATAPRLLPELLSSKEVLNALAELPATP